MAERALHVRFGERRVGDGCPTVFAAEIGINHNGDMALARRMIDAAADAGADAVKFQNYRTEDFLSDRTLSWEYESGGRKVVESQFDMFKRCELSANALAELCELAHRRGLLFFSTPTSASGVAELVAAGGDMLKNGSDYLVHLPLIRAMARSGKCTILSTGMATIEEIDDAVEAFRGAGGRELVLLVCTSAYPTALADAHVRRIVALRRRVACPVGFSDHTDGILAALAAVSLGACMVEKHFTLDKALPGPDHRFSADPAEFAHLVREARDLERALGDETLGPTAAETSARTGYRLSCVAAHALEVGHRLTEADLAFRRPATGLLPKEAGRILGARLRRAVGHGHVFAAEDFDVPI